MAFYKQLKDMAPVCAVGRPLKKGPFAFSLPPVFGSCKKSAVENGPLPRRHFLLWISPRNGPELRLHLSRAEPFLSQRPLGVANG